MREEKKKNNEKDEPTYYVDRDRAAAVVVGSKDIKSELKVKIRTNSILDIWILLTLKMNCKVKEFIFTTGNSNFRKKAGTKGRVVKMKILSSL